MVTQLLFGDLFTILARKEKWICIKTFYDDYECWIDIRQYRPLYEEVFQSISEAATAVSTDLVQVMRNKETNHLFPIVAGSSLPHFKNNSLRIDKTNYSYEGLAVVDPKPKRRDISENAYTFLNTPYLWGGRPPFGIEWSGFMQIVFKMCDFKLPRDAWQQAEKGTAVSFVEEAEEGD